MALTQFPFETDQPLVDVTLPVGVHRLQLVVEDSAGLLSEPDTVVITILPEVVPVPVITDVNPASGEPGSQLNVTISGQNLESTDRVEFLLSSGDPDEAMQVSILNAREDAVEIELDIAPEATAGLRRVRVTTPEGTATSSGTVGFVVVAEPVEVVISDFTPDSAFRGSTLEFWLLGDGLDNVTELGFFFPSTPPERDNSIAVILGEADGRELRSTVTIASSSPPGPRLVAVRTVDGQTVTAPEGMEFMVQAVAVTTPPIGTFTPPIGTITPPIGISTPPIGTITPPIVISTPPIGTITPPIGITQPPIGTFTPPIGITQPPIGTIAPPIGITQPPIGTIAPPIGITQPPIGGIGGIGTPIGGVIPGRLSPSERSVEEVKGIGPATSAKLADGGIDNLEALSQAAAGDVGEALGISEVRAMGFVDAARALLEEE